MQIAQEMDGLDVPLCFSINTIYDWGPSVESSPPVCMLRCSWEEDCNVFIMMDNEAGYHEGDEDYRPEYDIELDSCANRDGVKLEEGCYDYGFCSDKEEGRTIVMPIESGWETYYWIPTVYASDDNGPALCQMTYHINGVQNLNWDYDLWMCSEDEVDSKLC